MSCVTVAQVLAIAPELATFGGPGSGTVTFNAATVAADTVTIGATVGTAAAGPRVAGSNTWSTDGTTAAQLASFVEMLNDTAAGFAASVSGLATAPTVALVTSKATGPGGDIAWSTSDPVDIGLDPATGLTGGADLIEFYIACACKMVNADCWGDKRECAVIWLAAHLMTVANGASGGASGPVSSKTIDKISVSFATTTFDTSDAAYASTKYGQNYLAIRQTVLVVPVVGTGLPRFWPGGLFGRGRRRW